MTIADVLTSVDPSLAPPDPLLEPFQLKHLTLSSRIVSASHATAYAEDALPKERYLRYHLEKAKGGVAMTMMGGASCVAPESPAFVNNIALYKDEIVPHLRRLSDAVHEHDTLIMCQVTHAGRRTSNYAADWLPIISSSRIREDQHRSFPKVAEDWDIERTIDAFATGVERCREGGLDGVELMGVGQLLDQFWSPALNHRDDDWGGDFERRLRFPIEVLRAIRKRVGNEFVIGARIAIDELLPNGLQMEEGVALVNRLTEEGLDFLSLIRGGYDSDARLGGVIPPMGTKEAPHLDFAGEVKRQITIPVMHAGRIRNFDMARDALTAGKVDLIGMVRPLISDPYLVKHLREGTPERIRPTLGSGFGIDRIYQGGDMLDIGNPAVGRETTLPHIVPKAPQQKRAVVVGAGVAGLEAARTLAERGHDVTIVEATDRAGGQINLVTSVPRRQDFHRLIDWRLSELDHLNVQVRYNTKATAELVRNHAPDVVVVATGGTNHAQVPGIDPELLTDGWKVLTGQTSVRGNIMIFDDNGDHPGLAVAEALLATGAELEFVTPERSVGVDLGATNYPPYLKLFAQHGVKTTLTTRVTGAHRLAGGQLEVELTEVFSGITSHRIIDHLIVENGTIPADELYFELKSASINGGAVDLGDLIAVRPQNIVRNPNGTYQLFRVGDAVCSRNIAAAVLDSYRLCLAI